MFGERIQLRLRPRERNSLLQARENQEKMTAAIAQFRRAQTHRNPELVVRIGEMKLGRHHADNREGFAVQQHFLAEDLSIGPEAASPQTIAHHRHMRVAWAIFFWRKDAT